MTRLLAVSMLVLATPNACQEVEPARWRYSCGDPVCAGYVVKPAIPLCTGQGLGGRCEPEGLMCDPKDDCNRVLVCSVEDPGLAQCPDAQ
jgi:hypothetical protein